MSTSNSTNPTGTGRGRSATTAEGRLACGCPEYTQGLASRRSFLKGLGVLTAGGVISTMHGTTFTQMAFASSGQSDNVLVVLSMRGGCDGLSLVVPYNDNNYDKLRKSIAIPSDQLLVKDGTFGLHPMFAPLQSMWTGGAMAAVHGVGLAVPNRSHFSATLEVEDADPGSEQRIGWINRMVGMTDPESLFAAVQVSNTVPETEIFGPQPTLATDDVSKIVIDGPKNAMGARVASLDVTWGQLNTTLGQAVRDGMSTADSWGPVLKEPNHDSQYPRTDLGESLAEAAMVIKAGIGVQVVTVDHGSWDMHTDIGSSQNGDLQKMAQDLALCVSTFFDDLGGLASNVTVVTISEFGRMLAVNGDGGLDHGWGNAMFVLGAGVNGGKYYANGWKPLDPNEPDLPVGTDYRSVLWEVVSTRFPDVSLATLFPSFQPEHVGVMQGA